MYTINKCLVGYNIIQGIDSPWGGPQIGQARQYSWADPKNSTKDKSNTLNQIYVNRPSIYDLN